MTVKEAVQYLEERYIAKHADPGMEDLEVIKKTLEAFALVHTALKDIEWQPRSWGILKFTPPNK